VNYFCDWLKLCDSERTNLTLPIVVRISFLIAILVAALFIGSLFARTEPLIRAPLEVAVTTPTAVLPPSTAVTTATAVLPTGTLFVPTNTIEPTQSDSLGQFIRTYYQAINSRNYETTWSLLSDAFRASAHSPQNGGYQGYVDFWNTVDRVEVLEIKILEQSSQSAEVFVVANYHYKNGVTTTSEGNHSFIYDFRRNTWLFDVSR
jgi:serine/threonine-protein kinase